MTPWLCKRLGLVPITMGTVLAVGIVITFIIAVSERNVSPYMPFISEAGGNPPEGGIFSIFLYISSTVGLFVMAVRFMIINEFNQSIDKLLEKLNWFSTVVGVLSIMGMVVVAAYPTTVLNLAHNIGAYTLFLASLIYGSFQTWISYKMSPSYSELGICRTRLALTVLSGIFLVILLIFYPIADYLWNSVVHDHWKGSKVPGDKGFDMLLVSSIAEWIMAISFVLYFLTFFREFQKACIHVNIQILPSEGDTIE